MIVMMPLKVFGDPPSLETLARIQAALKRGGSS